MPRYFILDFELPPALCKAGYAAVAQAEESQGGGERGGGWLGGAAHVRVGRAGGKARGISMAVLAWRREEQGEGGELQ